MVAVCLSINERCKCVYIAHIWSFSVWHHYTIGTPGPVTWYGYIWACLNSFFLFLSISVSDSCHQVINVEFGNLNSGIFGDRKLHKLCICNDREIRKITVDYFESLPQSRTVCLVKLNLAPLICYACFFFFFRFSR